MRKKGFTLIELIIVVIIIGVLAAIAAPMMMAASKKTIASEAITALSRIRSAMREYYVEHNFYTNNIKDLPIKLRTDGAPGQSDLDGTYFAQECYSGFGKIFKIDDLHFFIMCDGAAYSYSPSQYDNAPQKSWAHSHGLGYISMHENGSIYSTYNGLGYQADPQDLTPP